MRTGTVKFFRNREGWGFIEDDEGFDIFFWFEEILDFDNSGWRRLYQGERVQYEIGVSVKTGKRCATSVRRTARTELLPDDTGEQRRPTADNRRGEGAAQQGGLRHSHGRTPHPIRGWSGQILE